MKNKIIKIGKWFLPVFAILLFAISCDDDDDAGSGGNFDLAMIEASLEEARNLLSATEEGIMAGDQQPGSKDLLQSVIAAVERIISSADSQDEVDDAGVKIQAGIQTYIESVVSEAFPWVQQEDKTAISISSNVRPIIAGEFTIQGEFYIVNLTERAFFNNMFALNGFPDSGFTVRYSNDGSTRLLVGDGSWAESPVSAPGVFKAGEWVNVAFTSTGNTQTLYVNGNEIVTMDKTLLLPNPDDVTLSIGNSPVFSERTSNLLTREFTIWNTVLSPDQIQANVTAEFDGTEANLEAYFPFSSDLGTSFTDVTGNYTATLVESVVWVSEPPVIVLDYTSLDVAITALTELKANVNEGDQDGDYPFGTIDLVDELLANANTLRGDESAAQDALENEATDITTQIGRINAFLVADTQGIKVDEDDPTHVGMNIVPNFLPTGDYTYEVDFMLEDLLVTSNGGAEIDLFGSNVFGFRVIGYTELTEENVLNAGRGWNFTFVEAPEDADGNILGNDYRGGTFESGTVKPGVWHHAAVVYNSSAGTTQIFVDGVDVTIPVDPAGRDAELEQPQFIGAAAGDMWLGRVFQVSDGMFKDYRIWNTARTQEQLDVEIDGTEPGLEAYFPLDRVKGIKFLDETGKYEANMIGVEWNTSQ